MLILSQDAEPIQRVNGHHSSTTSEKEYAAEFLQQLLNETKIEPLDVKRAGRYRDALKSVVEVRQHGDLAAVNAAFQTLKQTVSELAELAAVIEHVKRIYTATEFMSLPPITYLDKEKLIPNAGLVMTYGPPGGGKSLWAKRLLAEISDNQPVMLVLGEGRGGTPDRLRAEVLARKDRPLSDQFYIYDGAVNLRDQVTVSRFIELVRPLKLRLLAFDTLSTCIIGVDENSAKEMTPVLASCATIQKQLDAAVLLIHHTTKDGKTFRGSSVLHGAMDAMYFIDQDNGKISLTSTKSKDQPLKSGAYFRIVQFTTRQDPDTGDPISGATLMEDSKVIVAPINRLSKNERLLLEALGSYPEGLTHTELRKKTDLARSSLRNAAEILKNRGYIKHEHNNPYIITDKGLEVLSSQVQ